MAFHVFIEKYGQEPECINPGPGTTARQALRLLGSCISGKRRTSDQMKAYAVGRDSCRYSYRDLQRLIQQ